MRGHTLIGFYLASRYISYEALVGKYSKISQSEPKIILLELYLGNAAFYFRDLIRMCPEILDF